MSSDKNYVAHLGGVFLYSEKPGELAEWYTKHFGFRFEHSEEYNAYYYSFPYKETGGGKYSEVVWSIMGATDRPRIEFKGFVINFRVQDIKEFADALRTKGVSVSEVDEFDEGRFAWLTDLEGNHIELWEEIPAEDQ